MRKRPGGHSGKQYSSIPSAGLFVSVHFRYPHFLVQMMPLWNQQGAQGSKMEPKMLPK